MDTEPITDEEWYVLVPESEVLEWGAAKREIFKRRMAFSVVSSLALLDHKATHPKVDAVLASASDYLERWFDETDLQTDGVDGSRLVSAVAGPDGQAEAVP